MITRLSASIIGLLAFAGAIFMGLAVGNSFETILLRALAAMAGGMVVGWLAGYVGQVIVQENFRQLVEAESAEETAEAEASTAGDGAEEAVDDKDLSKAGSDNDRVKEDVRSDGRSLSARAARELMTNAS